MNLTRRSFLTGVAAAALAPVLPAPPRQPFGFVPFGAPFKETPQFMQGLSQRVAHTMIYGNPDWHPMQFTGLTPFYSPPPEECNEAA